MAYAPAVRVFGEHRYYARCSRCGWESKRYEDNLVANVARSEHAAQCKTRCQAQLAPRNGFPGGGRCSRFTRYGELFCGKHLEMGNRVRPADVVPEVT